MSDGPIRLPVTAVGGVERCAYGRYCWLERPEALAELLAEPGATVVLTVPGEFDDDDLACAQLAVDQELFVRFYDDLIGRVRVARASEEN